MHKLTSTPPVGNNRPINDSNNHSAVNGSLITQQPHTDQQTQVSNGKSKLAVVVGGVSFYMCVWACEMRQAFAKWLTILQKT